MNSVVSVQINTMHSEYWYSVIFRITRWCWNWRAENLRAINSQAKTRPYLCHWETCNSLKGFIADPPWQHEWTQQGFGDDCSVAASMIGNCTGTFHISVGKRHTMPHGDEGGFQDWQFAAHSPWLPLDWNIQYQTKVSNIPAQAWP